MLHVDEAKKLNFVKLFRKFVERKKEVTKKESCDYVFCAYLRSISATVSETRFLNIFKFIVLYRQALNYYNRLGLSEEIFTESYCAEDAIETANEFVQNFLQLDKNKYEFEESEVIRYLMHLGAWLFENGYSSLKLFKFVDN